MSEHIWNIVYSLGCLTEREKKKILQSHYKDIHSGSKTGVFLVNVQIMGLIWCHSDTLLLE